MNGLIEVKIIKGTLLLTKSEFAEGLKRGKAILRARKQEQRETAKRTKEIKGEFG